MYCYYFVYLQRPEDRILTALVRKTEIIQQQLGSLSQVIEGRLADLLRLGIRHTDVNRLVSAIAGADLDAPTKATVTAELDAARERQQDLLKQIDRLRDRLERSQQWLGLREEPFRAALSAALRLQGAEPLQRLPGEAMECYQLLTARLSQDPTWAVTLDTLRVPRRREQKLWEWRKEAPLRPLVFQAPDTLDDTVVQLHLEHRVVQRLLGRFTAQGFVHHDLSRACFAHSRDPIPRVILLGRLCLYGPHAARLHEELLSITARWLEPALRQGSLAPYAREAESKTLELLEAALTVPAERPVSEVILQRLQTSAARDVQELLPHLERRGLDLAERAAQRLRERGDKEAQDMMTILTEQQKRVAETADRFRNPQLSLDFDDSEKRQLEANRRHWAKRLEALDRELISEPDRIRAVYAVRARRLEPVGLVYLWPVTG